MPYLAAGQPYCCYPSLTVAWVAKYLSYTYNYSLTQKLDIEIFDQVLWLYNNQHW